MDEFINPIDIEYNEQEPISVFPEGVITTPLPLEIVNERAAKYNFALGEKSPGVDKITGVINNGDEAWFRRTKALEAAVEEGTIKQNLVDKLSQNLAIEGRRPTLDEINMIRSMSATDIKDPQTFFESEYAKKAVTMQSLYGYTNSPATLSFSDSDFVKMDFSAELITKQELARKLLQDVQSRWETQSFGSQLKETLETFVPFLSWYRMTNALKGEPVGKFLLGENKEAQYNEYYNMPLEMSSRALELTIQEMERSNPILAMHYLSHLLHYGASERYLDNAFNLLELAIPGSGTAGVAIGRRATKALKDTVASHSKPATNLTELVDITGDLKKGAEVRALASLGEQLGQTPKGTDAFQVLRNEAQPLYNPVSITEALGQSSVEASRRLVQYMAENGNKFVEGVLNGPLTIDRLEVNSASYIRALAETEEIFNHQYPHLVNTIVGLRPIVADKTLGNVHHIAFEIGTKEATYFGSAEAAELVANELYKLKSPIIKQRGQGYYIEITKPVDETAISVRTALAEETKHDSGKSLMNTFLGFLRSNEDKLSETLVKDLKIATYGSTGLVNLMREMAQPIGKLRKSSRQDLNRLLEKQRVYDNGGDTPGKFSRNVGELEKDFKDLHNRLPTEKEKQAYFTYVQLNDMDWTLRNLNLYRDKARQGIEMHNFPYTSGGAKFKDPMIEGKVLKDIPWNIDEDAGILIISDRDPDKWNYVRKAFLKSETSRDADIITSMALEQAGVKTKDVSKYSRDDLINMINRQDYKVVQISHHGEQRFRNLPYAPGDNAVLNDVLPQGRITFVLTKELESAPLEFIQIPRKPGGHFEYADGWFTKQANMSEPHKYGTAIYNTYYGDTTAFHWTNRADAERWTKIMEEGRLLLGDTTKLEAWAIKNWPESAKTFAKKFEKGPNGEKPLLNKNEPFKVVEKGDNIENRYKISDDYKNRGEYFENIQNNPYSFYNGDVNMQYAGERNRPALTIANTGTETAPVYDFKPSKMLDPIAVIDKASEQLMKGRYMDDLKHKLAERFVAEFSDILDQPIEQMRRNPYKALLEAPFKSKIEDKELLAAARNTRRATLEFMGLKTQLQKDFDVVKDNIVTSIVGKEIPLISNVVEWASTKDWLRFTRTIAFHEKLGLFNPVQMWLQAQTLTHMAALEGFFRTNNSLAAGMMMRWTLNHPQFMDKGANLLKAFNWKPEHYKEAVEWMHKSGFYKVGGEYSSLDDFLTPRTFLNPIDKGLNKAAYFFRRGEEIARDTAWMNSYSRWREANPLRMFDNEAAREVLQRADLLTMNMSRASNASWQSGFLSIPTQFWSYQARLSEQLLGKRLTTDEKARVITWYGAMYGFPVAAGAVTAVWPWADSIRGEMLRRGIQYDDSVISKMLVDGIPSMITEYAIDEKMNVGSRYGPGGNQFLKDLIDGKKGMMETVFGVSYSTIGGILRTVYTGGMSIYDIFKMDNEYYPLVQKDFVDALRNASSFNQAYKAYVAWSVGQYISKNETLYDDRVNGWTGLFMGLTGTEPQSLSDMWLKMQSNKDLDEYQKYWEKDAIKYLRQGFKSEAGSAEQVAFFKRAKTAIVMGGFRPDQHSRILSEAAKGYEASIYKIGNEFAKFSPERMKAWENEIRKRTGQ